MQISKNLALISTISIIIFGVIIFSFQNTIPKNDIKGIQSINIQDISVTEAHDLMKKNNEIILLDVRTQEEFKDEHIPNSINIFKDSMYDELDKEKKYIIYCRSGKRSKTALQKMQNLNFTNVYNVLGGIEEWKLKNLVLNNN